MSIKGIFSISQVLTKQTNSQWFKKYEPWIIPSPSEGVSNASNYAFWIGGYTQSTWSGTTNIYRLEYNNDNADVSKRSTLAAKNYYNTPLANNIYGYSVCGVGNSAMFSTIQRLQFDNDTITPSTRSFTNRPNSKAAGAGTNDYGWIAGGSSFSEYNISDVERITYANDLVQPSYRGTLTGYRQDHGGVSNANYMWVGADPQYSYISVYDRIDFSNDTATASPRCTQAYSLAQNHSSVAGNSDYGWWVGGYQGSPFWSGTSYVTRIDYANDLVQPSTRGPVASSRYQCGATGNSSYGYNHGITGNTSLSRIDYSNDTSTAAVLGNLPESLYRTCSLSAVANAIAPYNGIVLLTPGANDPIHAFLTPQVRFAYVTGGESGSPYSFVERIDYANDTVNATVRGNLITASTQHGNNTSLDKGYAVSGYYGSPYYTENTSIQRINYLNDTSSANYKGYVSHATVSGCGVGNKTYGYHAIGRAGYQGGYANYSYIERLDYSNDTVALSAVAYTQQSGYLRGPLSNENYGYFVGGAVPYYVSSIERIDYANDLAGTSYRSMIAYELPSMYFQLCTSNNSYGWISFTQPFTTNRKILQKYDFANDTVTASTRGVGEQNYNRSSTTSTGNSNYGYSIGGQNLIAPYGPMTFIERLDYANDTSVTTIRGSLPNAKTSSGSVSPLIGGLPSTGEIITPIKTPQDLFQNYVYYGGGRPNGGVNSTSLVQRLDFNAENVSPIHRTTLYSARYSLGATGNTSLNNYGYFGGGAINPDAAHHSSTVQRIDYTNDTDTLSVRGGLYKSASMLSASGNTDTGYFAGGVGAYGENFSAISKIDYSNDSVNALSRGPLWTARYLLGSAGNNGYGYFGGGKNIAYPNVFTSIERLDYANDTSGTLLRGPLAYPVMKTSASGNLNSAYFFGGDGGGYYTTLSYIQKILYSNDTITTKVRGQLFAGRYRHASAGGYSAAWISGGLDQNGPTSSVERFNYANDLALLSYKAPLTTAVNDHGASATQAMISVPVPIDPLNYGYIFGGTPTAGGDILDGVFKLDYSNDTATIPYAGFKLTSQRYRGACTSTYSYAYIGGGDGGGSARSNIEKYNYVNDTSQNTGAALQNDWSEDLGAAGNLSYGYWFGGGSGGPSTYISKLDYSSDTAIIPRTPFQAGAFKHCAFGNANFGYAVGGQDANWTATSIVQRIEYANDTATPSYVGYLDQVRKMPSGTSNGSYGWVIGGQGGYNGWSNVTSIARIDFGNDTNTALYRSGLTGYTYDTGTATGNNFYGYFQNSWSTTVQRIDYSNDTTSPIDRASMSTGVRQSQSTSPALNGFG